MNKAVIYARVSSKDQEIEGYSIPAQLKLLQEYARKQHLTVVEVFAEAETAKKAGRKGFNKMLAFLERNKDVKHILVEKTDRLVRNIPDYYLIDRLIETSHIKVHLEKETTILSSDSRSNEKFIFGIKALMAKNYIDNLSEEINKGMTEKASQGIYPSRAPYGYVNINDINGRSIIKIDADTACFVRLLFELYGTGLYSLPRLKKKMLAEGMVYKKGKPLYVSNIEGILKNPFYTGVFLWKGKTYRNASHDPLVSKELFHKVQRIMRSPYKSKSRKELFPYTNLIKCGVCGCALTAEIKKEKYIYYHCTGYKGNCKQPYLKQEVLESTFEQLLTNIQISDEIKEAIIQGLRESLEQKIEYHNNLVKQIERQIRVLQTRIDHAYMDKLDKKITEEFWQHHTNKWLAEKEELSIALLAAQKADTHYLKNANIILELAQKAAHLFRKQDTEQKRRLINLLVSNCTYKDEKLDLELESVFKEIGLAKKGESWCAQEESNL